MLPNEGDAAEATPGFWLFESFSRVQCGLVVPGTLAFRWGRPADRRRWTCSNGYVH